MPRNQLAYRRRHSTGIALALVFFEFISALDDGNLGLMALLDLSPAFDGVDHDILLSRLNITYGIGLQLDVIVPVRQDPICLFRWHGTSSRAETMHSRIRSGAPLVFVIHCRLGRDRH